MDKGQSIRDGSKPFRSVMTPTFSGCAGMSRETRSVPVLLIMRKTGIGPVSQDVKRAARPRSSLLGQLAALLIGLLTLTNRRQNLKKKHSEKRWSEGNRLAMKLGARLSREGLGFHREGSVAGVLESL